jgi:H/ACA ribonucleoprotein complex subunit 4
VGGIVRYEDDIGKDRLVAIFTLKGELVAIGKSLINFKDIKNISKGLAVKTDRVLMKKGTYASSL